MTTIGRLDSYFTSLITDLMEVERQSLYRLKEQRDTTSVRRGAYEDLRSKLDEFQDLVQSLRSNDAFTVVKTGRSVSVSNTLNEAKVLTASAGSSTVPGTYDLVVSQLARAQSRDSAIQPSADLALGLDGDFWLGGTGAASASVTPDGTIAGADQTGTVAANQRELGTGTYSVERRDNGGVLEFRLKDVDGRAVSIRDWGRDDGSFTTGWQAVPIATEDLDYDTGRGLAISFGGAGSAGSTAIAYTAAGTKVDIDPEDSLIDIATAINEVKQPEGRDLTASVIGRQLVLTAAQTGLNHTMIYSDGAGLGFTTDLQEAKNAIFTVNQLEFIRAGNTGLTDVIQGMTLNLAADAEGNQAALTVRKDLSGLKSAIESFVAKFNSIQAYLESKTAITSTGTGQNITYLRGTLSGDSVFNDLRTELFSRFTALQSNEGIYSSLRAIGVTVDSSLKATIDNDQLQAALDTHFGDVTSLLDAAMSSFDTLLARFTGNSSGYLDRALQSFDTEVANLDEEIKGENTRLEEKEQSLALQFASMQAQLINMSYMQQMWSGIYGSVSKLL
jgi:flagellar hook-associated protein 2